VSIKAKAPVFESDHLVWKRVQRYDTVGLAKVDPYILRNLGEDPGSVGGFVPTMYRNPGQK